MHRPSWSGGRYPCPGPVSWRPARGGGGGGLRGLFSPPPVRAVGRLRVPLAVCTRPPVPPAAGRPPTLGGRRRTSWTHRLLPCGGLCGALPVALARLALEWWGCALARCGASWTGIGGRWQMMSVGCWGRWDLCSYPRGRRLVVLREAACGCGVGSCQGSLSPGDAPACRPAPLGCEGCLGRRGLL